MKPSGAVGDTLQAFAARPDEVEANERFFDAGEFAFRRELEERHYWHLHRREVILEWIRRHVDASEAPALEIGCGNGFVTTHLNRHGCAIDYSDIHQRGLSIAQDRARTQLEPEVLANRSFLVLDITTEPMPSGYRGALMLDVLEHLPDEAAVLGNIAAALPDAGYLLVTVPAFDHLWSSWDEIQRHKRRYDRKRIRRALEENGFEIERMSYFFLPLWPAAAAVKVVRKLLAPLRDRGREHRIDSQIETAAPLWLNRLLLGILGLERRWLRRWNLPFGTSLLLVCRRNGDPRGGASHV